MSQTSYSLDMAIGRAGALVDSRPMRHVQSRLAVGSIKAGYGVFRLPGYGHAFTRPADPGEVYQSPTAGNAADVDAILASGGASTADIQVWEGAELNGVVGDDTMYPARKVTLVLSSHADWDATTAVLSYYDEDGALKSENLSIPNGGNATVTTVDDVSRVVSLTIPAQASTGGTFTIGVAALDSSITAADFDGVALYDASQVPYDTVNGYEYGDKAAVPVLRKGAIWMVAEGSVTAYAPAFIRTLSGSGGTQIGAVRADADTSTAIEITGSQFMKSATTGQLVPVEFF